MYCLQSKHCMLHGSHCGSDILIVTCTKKQLSLLGFLAQIKFLFRNTHPWDGKNMSETERF